MRRFLAATAATIALFGLTGCHRVFIGDSVMWQVGASVDRGDDDFVDGNIGRGPDWRGFGDTSLAKAIQDRIGLVDPGGWLVVQEAGDHDVSPAFVRWVVATVPDNICLGWVTGHDHRDKDVSAYTQAVLDNIGGQPCHTVIRWDQVDTTNLTYDTIHLNDEGVRVYAELILEALS